MKVSATSTVICIDKVLSSSLDRLSHSDADLAGRFHVDIERPENDTSQSFSEVRYFGFGSKVHVAS